MTSLPPSHKMGIMLQEAACPSAAEQIWCVCVCMRWHFIECCGVCKTVSAKKYEACCMSVSLSAARSWVCFPACPACNILIGAGWDFLWHLPQYVQYVSAQASVCQWVANVLSRLWHSLLLHTSCSPQRGAGRRQMGRSLWRFISR